MIEAPVSGLVPLPQAYASSTVAPRPLEKSTTLADAAVEFAALGSGDLLQLLTDLLGIYGSRQGQGGRDEESAKCIDSWHSCTLTTGIVLIKRTL